MRENLYKKILKNDLTILLLFFSLFVLGIFSLSRMTITSMPRHSRPALTIITDYYGMEPETIEQVITRPLERILKEVRGVKEIDSFSQKGRSMIVISLDPATDVDTEAVLIMDRVYHVSRNFPLEVRDPALYRYNTDDRPAVMVSLTGQGQSEEALYRLAETRIKKELLAIDGIANVEITGSGKEDYFIVQDYENVIRLAGDFDTAFKNVARGNVSTQLGSLKNEAGLVALDFPNAYVNLFTLPVYPGVVHSGTVEGHDLFSVQKKKREDVPLSFVDNRPSLILYVFKKDFSSILAVDRGVRNILDGWGDAFSFTWLYNQAEGFRNLLLQLLIGMVTAVGCILVLLILFYKRFLYVLLVMITIPLCLSGTLVLLAVFGMDLNIMTLSALIIGIGICVDNTLIIIEPLQKAMKRERAAICSRVGRAPESAGIRAGRIGSLSEKIKASTSANAPFHNEIGHTVIIHKPGSQNSQTNMVTGRILPDIMARIYRPLLASTVTTVAVFLPLFYMNAETVSLYADFARTISLMLLVSCLVSVFFIPSAVHRSAHRFFIASCVEGFPNTAGRHSPCKDLKVRLKKKNLADVMLAVIKRMLKQPMLSFALLFLYGIIFTVLFVMLDFRDVSAVKEKELLLFYEFDPEFNIAYREKVVKSIGDEILQLGFPLTLVSKLENERATFYIGFPTRYRRYRTAVRNIKAAVSALKRDDGFFHFESAEEIGIRQLMLYFFGNNLQRLNTSVDEVSDIISGWPGVDQILKGYKMGKPEIEFRVDAKRVYFYDLNVSDVIRFLRYIFYYPVVMKHYEDGEMIDVRGKIGVENITRENLGALRVPARNGNLVSLADFSTFKYQDSPGVITRRNGKRYISLDIQYQGMKENKLAAGLRSYLEGVNFHDDFYYEFDKRINERKNSRNLFTWTLIIAVFSVYAVLGIMFKSFSLPLIVMSSIFSVFSGAYLFLTMGGYSRSVPAHIGLILLIGLSVNSVILLLEEVLHLQKGTVCPRRTEKIILLAIRRKMRTIALMFFTTLFSVIPLFIFASSAYFFRVLTGVIFSGLLIGIPFSVLLFAVLYRVFYLHFRGQS